MFHVKHVLVQENETRIKKICAAAANRHTFEVAFNNRKNPDIFDAIMAGC